MSREAANSGVNRISSEKPLPAVSVILCVHNEKPAHLEIAIGSIVAQTFKDWELVLIDDGSNDSGTIAVEKKWSDSDARIRLYREPRRGLTASLNIGLGYSRASLVARHDSDDWSEPIRLERQFDFLHAKPQIGLLGSQIMLHAEDGRPLWESKLPLDHRKVRASFPRFNPFCHGATMFRTQWARRIGGYRQSLPCSQDYDFFWRLSELCETANLQDVLYHYRHSGRSVSSQRAADQMLVSQLTRVLARMRQSGVEDERAARVEAEQQITDRQRQRFALQRRADNLLLGGERIAAIKAHLELIRHFPMDWSAYAVLVRCVGFMILPPLRRYFFLR